MMEVEELAEQDKITQLLRHDEKKSNLESTC